MLDDLNDEQKLAIECILNKVDKLPYILFGPPGKISQHIKFQNIK